MLSARTTRGARARERAQREERERAERARQEERERDRAYQRELLSLVCSLVKGPSGSGLLEAARQETSCSGEVGAQVDRLLQPTVGATLTSAPSSHSSGTRVLDEHNMAARHALSPTPHTMAAAVLPATEPAPISRKWRAGSQSRRPLPTPQWRLTCCRSLSGSATPVPSAHSTRRSAPTRVER